ncbi:MAG: helix-turn-helix transcriptional regulator [Lentisphaerae bacterium]|nr:helix-turn-helix transcriptional regulator [Lentisphaerota bacterium]
MKRHFFKGLFQMLKNLKYPAENNFSVIPENFCCFDVPFDCNISGSQRKLNISSIFMVNSPAGWAISRTENFREVLHIDMFFILSGSICFQSASGSGRALSGQLLLIPSHLNRIIFLDENSTHLYIRLNGDFSNFGINELHCRNCLHIDEFESYIRILLNRNSPAAGNLIYRSNILENLIMLVHTELFPAGDQDSPEKISRLLDYLHKEHPAKLTVTATARKFAMSISTFRKFCLRNFQKSPGELLDDIRMSKARAMLIYSGQSIDSIAAACGYANRFAFSKAFTRLNGIAPGKFKEKSGR